MPRIQAADREFRRRFWLAIAVPLVLLAILAGLFAFQTNRLNLSLQNMSRSNTVLTLTSRLRQAIIDTQSDAQQFLLARNPAELRSYKTKQDKIPQIVDELARSRGVSDPVNDPVSQNYRAWRAKTDQAVHLAQFARYDPRRAKSDRQSWNTLLLSIDEIFETQIAERAQSAASAQRFVHSGASFGIGLVLILGILLSLFTRRQLQEIAFRYRTAVEDANEKAKAAERALASREDFFSIASHELRTPITAMELRTHALQAILERAALPVSSRASVNSAMRSLRRQNHRLSELIESMLDATQINAGQLHLHPSDTPVSVENVIQKGIHAAQELLDQFHCKVELHAEPAMALGWDGDRISQALKALISNSAKYAPNSTIEIRSTVEDHHVRIEISDYGLGIAFKDHPRIFRLFERGVSSRHYGGLGTGLYITREIIEAHQGNIRVLSQVGAGTTIIIDLPLSTEAGRAAAAA